MEEKPLMLVEEGYKKGPDHLVIASAFVIILVMFVASSSNYAATGAGVSLSNPQKSSTGFTISYDITISGDITKTLSSKSTTLTVANKLTSAVSQAKGLADDGLKALLNLPSPPDTIGVLASVAEWLNNNADACLRKIGETYNGKDFKGKFYFAISKLPGSKIYPDWDYYGALATYTAPNFKCQQNMGCRFSINRKTRELSKSCFG